MVIIPLAVKIGITVMIVGVATLITGMLADLATGLKKPVWSKVVYTGLGLVLSGGALMIGQLLYLLWST